MRLLKLIIIAFVAVILYACKGGDTISPTSEKIQGPLGQFFEVVTKDYRAKDGKVSVEIKRKKAGFPKPWKEGMTVGYSDGEFEPCFTMEFLDTDGNVVSKDKTDIVFDRDELNVIASLSTDESATITFKCKEKAKQFKLASTFTSHGEVDMTTNLEGSIGKYPILMTMHIAADGNVTGAYYYKSKGPGNYLYIKGEKSDDRITLNEFTKDGQQTGTYEGVYKNNVFKGHFNTKSGYYDFVLKPTEKDAINFGNIDFDSFNAEYIKYDEENSDISNVYSSDTLGSSNWDSWLDSYEQCVDKYISYVHKTANGDITALAEYASLMQKIQDLSNKMVGAQDEMSTSQWARYMKITNKMTTAVLEMQ